MRIAPPPSFQAHTQAQGCLSSILPNPALPMCRKLPCVLRSALLVQAQLYDRKLDSVLPMCRRLHFVFQSALLVQP